ARVDEPDVELHALPEDARHLLGLAGAEEPVVDEDAGQMVADGAMDQRRDDGRVDAAGERTDDALRANPLPDARHPLVDEALHRPVRRGAADAEDEIPEDLLAVDAVRDLGVELEAVDRLRTMAEGRMRRVLARGERFEIVGEPRHLIAVAHPDARRPAAEREERIHPQYPHVGGAERLPLRTDDLAAERVVDDVRAIADAEDGRRPLEDELQDL